MARPIIDLHSHFFPPAVIEWLSTREGPPRISGPAADRQIVSEVGTLPLGRHWHDVEHRLQQLDRCDVVHQLISWPTTLNLEPVLAVEEGAAILADGE